jgi:O-acetylhomoserine/O-acetylserine sulfhydrylase
LTNHIVVRFWQPARFDRTSTSPAEGYHGLKFSETFGKVAFAVKLRVEILRDLGAVLNPSSAFLLIQGLETPSLRAQRHSDNAQYLEHHEKVPWVSYLSLELHPSHQLALRTLRQDTFAAC